MGYYDYQEAHKSFILASGSLLLKRDDVLTGSGLGYRSYIDKIYRQWSSHPLHPFLQEGVPLERSSILSRLEINSEVKGEGFEFTGCKRVKELIYRDSNVFDSTGLLSDSEGVDDSFLIGDGDSRFLDEFNEELMSSEERVYWEFVLHKEEELENRKYLYITPRESLIEELKVPWYCYWDCHQWRVGKEYPSEISIVGANSENWGAWYSLIVEDMNHPYLKGFVFTGRVIEQGQEGRLGYEYTDVMGWYGIKNELYMSEERPSGLNFPLGIPKEGEVDRLKCNERKVGWYQGRGKIPIEIGIFTGYTTNRNYHPTKTFYIYERIIRIEEGGSGRREVYGSEEEPREEAEVLIEIAIEKCRRGGVGIYIEGGTGKEEIYIRDYMGCKATLSIRDNVCLTEEGEGEGELYNDCNRIGDDFINERIKVHMNDVNLIDDGFFMMSCAKREGGIGESMMNDGNLINERYKLEVNL